MDKGQSSAVVPGWVRVLLFFAIAAIHGWYQYGFVPIAGQLTTAFFGGLVIYFGLKKLLLGLLSSPLDLWALVFAPILLALGSLSLIPSARDDWLLKTPFGWSVLEDRIDRLERALRDEQVQQVRNLVRAGLGNLEPRDSSGGPIIEDADNSVLLTILLDAGLDPDARFEGETTLLMKTQDVEIARVLLAYGADINARDDEWRTPLMHAGRSGPEMIKVLLEAGAQVNTTDNFARTVADHIGDDQQIESLLRAYADGALMRGADLGLFELASQEWVDQRKTGDPGALDSSSVALRPDPMTFGDQAELTIRLSNHSENNQVLLVEARLNSAALFVGASDRGKIANPHQAQLDQRIRWPKLALPAHSSGVITLNIIAPTDYDPGDLSVDIRAQNLLDYSQEPITLNAYQTLKENSYKGEDLTAWAVILVFPLSILVWVLCLKFLGSDHSLTNISQRFSAGVFTLFCAFVIYRLTIDTIKPYTSFVQTEAIVLDRRIHMVVSNSSSSNSGSTAQPVPIVAVRYFATDREVISTGFSKQAVSMHIYTKIKLGAEVPCWYDPDNPSDFVLTRGVSFLRIMGLGIMSIIAIMLGWVTLAREQ